MDKFVTQFELETRTRFRQHPLFAFGKEGPKTPEQLMLLFSQYWRPLHFFPDFLAGLLCISNPLEAKTFISEILFQELGEGNPALAHETAYFTAMEEMGLDPNQVRRGEEFPATQALMRGFRKGTRDLHYGFGMLLATEVADLAIVAGLGRFMTAVTGSRKLLWVDLHVKQEPAHVKASTAVLVRATSTDHQDAIIAAAHECSDLWYRFFLEIHELMAHPSGAASA